MRELTYEYSEASRPVRHLIEYSCDARLWNWSYDGQVVATYGDVEFRGAGHGSWATSSIGIQLPRYSASRLQSNGQYGLLVEKGDCPTIAAVDGSWRSTDVWVRHAHRDDEADDVERVDVQLNNLIVGDPDALTPSHALVVGAGGLSAYPHSLPLDREGQGASVDGVITTLFGRPAVLRDIPTGETSHDLLVVYEGARFTTAEQVAVWLVIMFLAGTPCAITAAMAVDGSREIGRCAYAWCRATLRARPPIVLTPFYPPNVGEQISQMCEKAKALTEVDDVHIDVALMHLFADHRDLLDLELRDLTLALDSLVESSAKSEGKATAISRAEYAAVRPHLEAAITETLSNAGLAGGALEKRLLERLQGGNDMSVTRRREAFWSRVAIQLKDDEIEALANRHAMAHAGVLLRRSGDEKMQKLLFQVEIVRTLVNRTLLSLLGYRGPVLNYLVGRNMSWEHFEQRPTSVFGTYGSD